VQQRLSPALKDLAPARFSKLATNLYRLEERMSTMDSKFSAVSRSAILANMAEQELDLW
jgi:hypothetical protein